MSARAADPSLRLPLRTMTLANGLRVALLPDPAAPAVAVSVLYFAGAKDDPPGRGGLAHFVEHLMFDGAAGWDGDYFGPLQEAGGSVNGSTSHDLTVYYEVVPPEYLGLALWLEADRMGNLAAALTDAKVEKQRGIVRNERRQRTDNAPYGRTAEAFDALCHAADHPYRRPVLGSFADLAALGLDDCRRFHARCYAPANACLAIAGRFDPDDALRLCEERFGGLRGGVALPLPAVPPPPAPQRGELADDVALPRLDLAFPGTARHHPAEPALDVVAELLAGPSKNSRLDRRLVREDRRAASVSAAHATRRLGGLFRVQMLGLAGADPAALEAAARGELAALAGARPPTAEEMTRVQAAWRKRFLHSVETALGRAQLVQRHWFHRGEPHAELLAEELAAYQAVTADDVQRAAAGLGEPQAALLTRPGGQRPAPSHDAPAPAFVRPPADAAVLPRPGRATPYRPPVVETATLANGVTIYVASARAVPLVQVEFAVSAGSACEGSVQRGAARLLAALLGEGTQRLPGPEFAAALEALGAGFAANAGVDVVAGTLTALAPELPAAFRLAAEALSEPRLDAADVLRERGRLAAALSARRRDAGVVAEEALAAAVFGAEHPYGRPANPHEEELLRLEAGDLRRFHAERFAPSGLSLAFAGDIGLDDAVKLAEAAFGSWTPRALPDMAWPAAETAAPPQWLPRPGTQTALRMAAAACPRGDADYLPAGVLATALGGHFLARLNRRLREELAITYGARATLLGRRRGGMLVAATAVDAGRAAEALAELGATLRGLADEAPLTAAELEAAKSYLLRRYATRFETIDGLAGHVANLALHGLPADDLATYSERVAAVTLDDLHRVAERYFGAEAWRAVAVGPVQG